MSSRSHKVIFCRRQGVVIELCDPILYLLLPSKWNWIVFFSWRLSIKCIPDQYYCIKWLSFVFRSIANVLWLLLWIIYGFLRHFTQELRNAIKSQWHDCNFMISKNLISHKNNTFLLLSFYCSFSGCFNWINKTNSKQPSSSC